MTARRKPIERPRQRGIQIAKPVNWLAPTAGFRSDKPLEALPPNAAAVLTNFFPEPGYVRPRSGTANWATGLGGQSVQSLMAYYGVSGTVSNDKMFAAAGTKIYDVTSPVTNPTAVYSSSTNANYSWAPFATSAGTWLMAVNGADAPISYNGTTWANAAITGNSHPLIAVAAYQSRLYFLEKASGFLWYMPTLGITGALAGSLNIGAVFKYGGRPVDLAQWTVQSVSGPILMLCIISTEGEVVVYSGSDPTSSSNFTLVGSFKLGFPLGGTKAFYQIGGDLAVMTVDGIVPMSKAITLDPSAIDQASLTGPIAPTWLQTVRTVGQNTPGWQLMIYPSRRMAIVNVPDPVQGAYQYVMNTETQAWTRFVGMPATVWLAWEGGLYFGTADGRVVQADIGSVDQQSNGVLAPIDCLMVGAWKPLSDGMSPKTTTLISINCVVDATVQLFAGVSFDFNNAIPVSAGGGIGTQFGATWDVSEWDVGLWGGSTGTRVLANANGTGYIFAPTIRALIDGTTGEESGLQIIGGTVLVLQGQGI